MWAVKESSSSMVTPRFLAEDEGVTVADPRVIERLWKMEGLAGMMRSSVSARFSWRWCLVIQVEVSVRQTSILAEIPGSVRGNDRYSRNRCVSILC